MSINQKHQQNPMKATGKHPANILLKKIKAAQRHGVVDGIRLKRLNDYKAELKNQHNIVL